MAEKRNDYEVENREWIESLKWVIEQDSPERAAELMKLLQKTAGENDVPLDKEEGLVSDYLNTISADEEEDYPGDIEMEKKIYRTVRWNAMAMVARANKKTEGIGGHISTYSSISMLWEVGFNHFFHGYDGGLPDLVYFQGHASPGVYARSFVEYRLDEENLDHFRLEVQHEKGISSYPHPRLMPEYWRFPTVSMGLAPIQAIYQARFLKYLKNRSLIEEEDRPQQVWAFLGDGEMDEPESTGSIAIAAREKLDNLTFVINCNLQRLDGPVRGNSSVLRELEGIFRGAGWNVINVVWGGSWDKVFKKDKDGKLKKKFAEMPDGELQHLGKYKPEDWKEKFFTGDLAPLVEDFEKEDFNQLIRGGHDPKKIFNAYKKASETKDRPSVILAQTVKGFEQGEAGEASNVAHKTKKFKKEPLKIFRDNFEIPIEDDKLEEIPYYRFKEDSDEVKYLRERREKLGGDIPKRKILAEDFKMPDHKVFAEFEEGSGDDEVPTTGVFVKILTKLLKDENTKNSVIPIVPDESRTFGMDSLFSQVGIYTAEGQQYEPVDKGSLLFYNEQKDGVIIEEGITEAGGVGSFIAAGTNHMSQPFYTVPFFIFYSMFGFQRVGDLLWAAADARAKGFLVGGISGRTSLAGEGLQHADGNSHLYAMAYPSLQAYDPAFAYELAVIIEKGMERMYVDGEDIFYYITIGNVGYKMPEKPKDVDEDILNGLYRFKKSKKKKNADKKVNLFGTGAIMAEVLEAAETLEKDYDVPTDVWSVTSYKKLYDDARDTERQNFLKGESNPSHLQKQLKDQGEIFIAATDYVKALPLSIGKWIPGDFVALGTDGFGRSDDVEVLRDFFEVDAKHIVYHSLAVLVRKEQMEEKVLKKYAKENKINGDKANPAAY